MISLSPVFNMCIYSLQASKKLATKKMPYPEVNTYCCKVPTKSTRYQIPTYKIKSEEHKTLHCSEIV